MLTIPRIALTTAAIILAPASAALAKDNGPPKIDIEKTCRENSGALGNLTGNDLNSNFNVCMEDEKSAREQLVKNWGS